ncbi:MAG TPA: hypothetical protein VFR91_01415 [Dyella sp.]|nr:hypothetical protein [Dyella sp.]
MPDIFRLCHDQAIVLSTVEALKLVGPLRDRSRILKRLLSEQSADKALMEKQSFCVPYAPAFFRDGSRYPKGFWQVEEEPN